MVADVECGDMLRVNTLFQCCSRTGNDGARGRRLPLWRRRSGAILSCPARVCISPGGNLGSRFLDRAMTISGVIPLLRSIILKFHLYIRPIDVV